MLTIESPVDDINTRIETSRQRRRERYTLKDEYAKRPAFQGLPISRQQTPLGEWWRQRS